MVRLLAVEQITVPSNKRLCKCECGEWIDSLDNRGRERFYKKGHGMGGKKHSLESIEKMSGSNNRNWVGDNIGYNGLHGWLRRHLFKPEFCEICHIKLSHDIACVTGRYVRDISNFKWLCHPCHMKLDHSNGTIKRNKRIPNDRKCYECGTNKTQSTDGKGCSSWYIIDKKLNKFQCRKCYRRVQRSKKILREE